MCIFTHRFARKYNTLDKKKQTPITIVLAEWEESRYFASIKKIELNTQLKKDTAAVVAKILSKISEVEDQIKAIKQTFYGMTALEYDIKSGNGIIVEVKQSGSYVRSYMQLCSTL